MSSSITQFTHLQIPLEEILKATNNFSEKNIIGKGGFGNVYKGQLLRSGDLINISARRLDHNQEQGDMEFWTEISILSSLKHPNIVYLIGFCDDQGEKIIINRHEVKGSLGMYISDPALTWVQRLRICNGAAKAISYLHYEEGRSYSIIHRNINSSTILLDDNFEAKLSGFEFSIKDSMDRTECYIPSEVVGTQGYMDPESLKHGDVTQKSDIYSFGAVLLELMCGRKAFLPYESEDNKFLAPLVQIHYADYTIEDILIPDMWNQMGPENCRMCVGFTLRCLKTDREKRPNMDLLVCFLNQVSKIQLRRATL
ncbi:protein kinase-like domain, concanavalin A-like lectin/glucanase domain protein, partial [Tanacetum coccineum]